MSTDTETKRLGRYELLFKLGAGGMGEVHLAKLTGAAGFEKLCIVKTILKQMQAQVQFVERFHHEARVLVQLNHANIAQVYDMGEADGTLYMAIEYVPGVDLSRIFNHVGSASSLMPIPICLYVARQLCEGLGYAHRKTAGDGAALGIVHRDVSPQNTMVSYEGEVKVIDFGLAKSSARSNHTLPQTVLGKLGYMSPEQAMAKSMDHRSDIYSAGIVIWEMLAGRPLFTGGTMGELLVQMANPTIPSLTALRSDVSQNLEAIVMRSLAKDPAARYNRADDFARALNELAVREGLTIGAEEVGNYVRAMCPEEFAAERRLQSQLSILRKKGSSPQLEIAPLNPQVRPGTTSALMDGTLVRESAPMTPAQLALSVSEVPTSSERRISQLSGSPAQKVVEQQAARAAPSSSPKAIVDAPEVPSAEIVVPKSKAPLIVVAVLAGLVVVGAIALFAGGSKPPQPAPVAVPTPKPLDPVPAPVAPADKPAVAEPVPTPAPTPASAAPTETIDVPGEVLKLVREGGKAYIILEKGQKLSEGDRLTLVGEPINGSTKRPLLGSAAVLELKGALANLIVEEDFSSGAGAKVYAVRDAAVARPKPGAVAVAKVEPVKPAPEPVAVPVKPEPVVVAKVEPKPEPRVEPKPEPKPEPPPEPKPAPAKVEPVKVEPVKAEPVKVEAAKPQVKLPQLFGVIRVRKDLYGQVARFENTSSYAVSGCKFRLPNRMVGVLKPGVVVPSRGQTDVPYAEFKPDPDPVDPQFASGWALVRCAEGVGYVKAIFTGQ